MRALQPSDETGVVSTTRRARRRSRVWTADRRADTGIGDGAQHRPPWRRTRSMSTYPPGPTVVADPNSPTGYTGHFVYCNPDRDERAIRRRHHAAQLGGPDRHEGLHAVRVQAGPDARRRRVRRGDDERRRRLLGTPTCRSPQVPTSTGSTSTTTRTLWLADPGELADLRSGRHRGTAAARLQQGVRAVRRGEAELRASRGARQIENPREPTRPRARGATFRSEPAPTGGTIPRTLGVYLPPDYDAEPRRAVQDDLHAARRRPGPVRLDEHGQRPGHHGQPAPGRHHRARGRHHDEHELPRTRRNQASRATRTPTCATS